MSAAAARGALVTWLPAQTPAMTPAKAFAVAARPCPVGTFTTQHQNTRKLTV